MSNAATVTQATDKTNTSAVYTRTKQEAGEVVLWLGSDSPRAPIFSGLLNGKPVAFFLQEGSKGKFFNVIDSKAGKNEQGYFTRVATANVRINPVGIPKLVIDLGDKSIWADFKKNVTEDMLIHIGMDVAKRDAKKAEYEAKKQPTPNAPATSNASAETPARQPVQAMQSAQDYDEFSDEIPF